MYFKFYPDSEEKQRPEIQETAETAESAKLHSQDERWPVDMEVSEGRIYDNP